jgi:sensor c-di-GMP phosphodiesterase-like protein
MKLASSHRSGGAADVEQEVGDVVERVAAGGPCDRQLGVVDDFGTGYSSLAYLRRFPIDRIKLDRSFVRELPEFEQTAAIVRAICGLSKAIDLELVAEGIEREAEAAFLEGEAS